MRIEAGQELLHYRLVEKIGEGGMGVVWRATDTSLNRDVAIKFLPELFSGDAERLARFEREAKLLASLSHPNIAGIFGLHEHAGRRFLAMELIEGQDLAQQLSRGALPLDEAVKIAQQIAQALEAAHESGVIHRDLKPANVKLTQDGAVKVLDFGLAKALAPDAADERANPALSPTMTSAGSVVGMILGTAAYMSPEQAKGKPVDRRADIWSFGVVLFEMLTGRRLFDGETVSETMAAVLMKDPDWAALPAGTPGSLKRLLQRCLQRDPRSRLRDIGDARIELEEMLRSPEPVAAETASAPRRNWLPWIVTAAALVALAFVVLSKSAQPPALGALRLRLPIPEAMRVPVLPLPSLALSPDGRRIAFVGLGGEEGDDHVIYLRAIDQPQPVALPGTEGAASPIFSPDGRHLAYAQDGKLKKMPIAGGAATTLCDAPLLRGASWGDDGTIVFSPDRATGLMRVSAAGGSPEPLTTPEADPAAQIQPSHRWPFTMPGGNAVLFTATDNDSEYDDARIVALSLADRSQKLLVEGGSYPRYAPAGFLTFLRDRTLFAARFDAARLELLGPAVPVLEGVANVRNYGSGQMTFSDTGILAYIEQVAGGAEQTLAWVERDGRERLATSRVARIEDMRLSPDESQAVLQLTDDEDRQNLWILEFERDTLSRLTFDSMLDADPVWSPDSEWIVFDSIRNSSASRNLYRMRANGTGEIERLTTSPRHQNPWSWSPDGRIVAFVEVEGDTKTDIMLLHVGLGEPPKVESFLNTPFDEGDPAISPDGRWLAYASNESGRMEVYVLPFGRAGGRTKLSTQEARSPSWSPDGSELLYVTGDEQLMSVRVTVEGSALRPALPTKVIDYPESYGAYSVSRDGRRLLVVRDVGSASATLPEPTVVIGWFEELAAQLPAER